MTEKRPQEHEYASYVSYSRALEDYCNKLDKQREWLGLTDEEATQLWDSTDNRDSWELIKRVEAMLKGKNK